METKKNQDIQEKQLAVMKKQLGATRLLLLIMALIMLIMVFEGAVLLPPVLNALNEVSEAAQTINDEILPVLAAFDSDALNNAVSNFDKTVQELDIDSLNNAVASLDDTVSELNIDELNTAITGLSQAVESISKIGSLFR